MPLATVILDSRLSRGGCQWQVSQDYLFCFGAGDGAVAFTSFLLAVSSVSFSEIPKIFGSLMKSASRSGLKVARITAAFSLSMVTRAIRTLLPCSCMYM